MAGDGCGRGRGGGEGMGVESGKNFFIFLPWLHISNT